MKEQKVLQIKFSGLAGESRKMSILKMGHRDFWETYHTVIQAISGGVKVNGGKVAFNPIAILKGLDFDDFEKIAVKTLAYGVLDGHGTVKNPFEDDHFMSRPDELYAAVYAGFVAQNPDMFPKKKGVENAASTPQEQEGGPNQAPETNELIRVSLNGDTTNSSSQSI